jgi:hypothetical protein
MPKKLMKRFLQITLVVLCFALFSHNAYCTEIYSINNNQVLLYKIINWWYDCLPEESDLLCGSLIKYQNKGNAHVEYNDSEMILKLRIDTGFADQLSVFRACEQCSGPAYFHCTWLNKDYLGNDKTDAVPDKLQALNSFTFQNIGKKQAQRLRDIETDILFEIEGVIFGLMNGKIALYHGDDFLKTCPDMPQNQEGIYPCLKIINGNTNEELAKYSVKSDN